MLFCSFFLIAAGTIASRYLCLHHVYSMHQSIGLLGIAQWVVLGMLFWSCFLLLVTSVPLLFSLCLRYLCLNYFQYNESELWLIGNSLMCRGGQAAMEVLRQADAGKSNIKRIKRLYRMLQRKQLNQVRIVSLEISGLGVWFSLFDSPQLVVFQGIVNNLLTVY